MLLESDQWGIRDGAAVRARLNTSDLSVRLRNVFKDNDLLILYRMKLHSCTVKTEPEKEMFLNTHGQSSAGMNVTQCDAN